MMILNVSQNPTVNTSVFWGDGEDEGPYIANKCPPSYSLPPLPYEEKGRKQDEKTHGSR